MPDEINLDMGEGQDEVAPGPTSDINLHDDGSRDEELEDEKPEDGDEPKPKEDLDEDGNPIDWKQRYGDSTREFQKLQVKLKEGEGLTAQERQRAAQLQTERDEALEKLKAEKPEVYDNHTLKKQLDSTSLQLAEMKEKGILDDFIADEPLAKPFRDALRAHARAFPNKSIQDIWNESFKEIAAAKKETATKADEVRKKSQPDRGSGATREPGQKMIGGYTEAEFNKLSVNKRRELMVKAGIKI